MIHAWFCDVVRGEVVDKLSRSARNRRNQKLKLGQESDWKCVYCGRQLWPHTITIDHVIPKVKGGAWLNDNKLASCSPCNNRKGSKMSMSFRPACLG